MSTGPIVQLVAKSREDRYLTETPEITFFKSVWFRNTNHAIESIAQTFNGAVKKSSKVSATIARHGDLVYQTWLEVELPAVPAREAAPAPAEAPRRPAGDVYSLIDHVTVKIGETRVDRHYGEWMRIWDELTVPYEHRSTLYHLTNWDEEDGWLYGQPRPAPVRFVRVPLSFWFCKDAGNALPLIALKTHEVRVDVHLTDLIPAGAKLRLWVDYVFLGTAEREAIARGSHEYLIEQVQASVEERVPNRANRVKKIRLDFNHPIKELFWVVRDAAGDIQPGAVQRARLLLNGEERFCERDGDYFSVVQRYAYHSCAGDIFPGDTADVLVPFVAMTTRFADDTPIATYDAAAQTLTSLGTASADSDLPTGQQVGERLLSPDHFNFTDADFGRNSALSADGTVLVVGSTDSYKTPTSKTGSVRSYQQTAAGAWALFGELYGSADGQGFGRPALSDDGLTLVVGSATGSHAVRAYRRKPAPALAPTLCTLQTEAPSVGGYPYQSYLTTTVAVDAAAGEAEANVAIPGADSLSYYSLGGSSPTDIVLTLAPEAGAAPAVYDPTAYARAANSGISVRFKTGDPVTYTVFGSDAVVTVDDTAGHAGFLGLRAVRRGSPLATVFEITVGGEVVEEVGAPYLSTTDGLHAGVWFGNRDPAAPPVMRGLRVNGWVPFGAPILAENTYTYAAGAIARAIPGSLLYPYAGANGVDTVARYQFTTAGAAEAAASQDDDVLGYRLDSSARVRVERNASIPFGSSDTQGEGGTRIPPTLDNDYWSGTTFGSPAIGVVTMDGSGAFSKQPTPSSADGWTVSGVTAVAPDSDFTEGATLYGATYDPASFYTTQAAAEAAYPGVANAIGYWKRSDLVNYVELQNPGPYGEPYTHDTTNGDGFMNIREIQLWHWDSATSTATNVAAAAAGATASFVSGSIDANASSGVGATGVGAVNDGNITPGAFVHSAYHVVAGSPAIRIQLAQPYPISELLSVVIYNRQVEGYSRLGGDIVELGLSTTFTSGAVIPNAATLHTTSYATQAEAEAACTANSDAIGFYHRTDVNPLYPGQTDGSGTDYYLLVPGTTTFDAATDSPNYSVGEVWSITRGAPGDEASVSVTIPSLVGTNNQQVRIDYQDILAVSGLPISSSESTTAIIGETSNTEVVTSYENDRYYVLTSGGSDTYSGPFQLPSSGVEQTWAESGHSIDTGGGLGLDWVTLSGGSMTYTDSRVDVVSFVCEEEGFVDVGTAVNTESNYDYVCVLVWRNYGTVTDISQRDGRQRLLASMSIAAQKYGRGPGGFDDETGEMMQSLKDDLITQFRLSNAAIYNAYTGLNAITGADINNIEVAGAYTSTSTNEATSASAPSLLLREGEVMYVMFYSDFSGASRSARVNFSATSRQYTLLYPPAMRPSATPAAFADDSNTVVKVAAQPNQLHGVVAIDADGDTVAVGAPQNTPDAGVATATEAGQVRVFQYENEAWAQLGPDIDGASYSEHAGFNAVSLSASGRTVAFGARNYDVGAGALLETVPVTVAVAAGGDSVYVLSGPSVAGTAPDEISLQVGNTYVFDQSDPSNSGHRYIQFESQDGNGAWVPITDGVSAPNTVAQTVTWVVPGTLTGPFRYTCSVHGAGMGGPLTLRANPVAAVAEDMSVTVVGGDFVVSGGAADVVAPASLPLVEGYTYTFYWTDATNVELSNGSKSRLTFEVDDGSGVWVPAAGITPVSDTVTKWDVPVGLGLAGSVRYVAEYADDLPGETPAGGPVYVVPASSRQDEGCVRVYDYAGGLWTQRGADIVDAPPATGAQFGCRVGMSRDGLVVAGGDATGRVRVVSWAAGAAGGGAWVGRGQALTDFGGLGAGLTMSGDGSVLAYATDDNDAAVRYWDGAQYRSLVRDLLVVGAATATPAALIDGGAASGHVDGVGLEEAAYRAATYGAKALLKTVDGDRYYFVYDDPGAPTLQPGSVVGDDTILAVYTVSSTVGDANFVAQSRDGRRIVLGAVGKGVRVFSLPAASSLSGFNGFGYVNGQGTYGVSTALPTLLAGTAGLGFQVHLLLSPVAATPVANPLDTAAYDAQRLAGVRLVLDDAGAVTADAYSTAEQDSLEPVATLDTGSNDFEARAGVRLNAPLGTLEAFVSNPSGESVVSFPAPAGATLGNLNASIWLFSVNDTDRIVANSLQWQQVRESQPVDRQGFIYMYSFALEPEKIEPSGSCNFSKIANANLELTTASNNMRDMRVYALNYNVFRVKDGQGTIAFST